MGQRGEVRGHQGGLRRGRRPHSIKPVPRMCPGVRVGSFATYSVGLYLPVYVRFAPKTDRRQGEKGTDATARINRGLGAAAAARSRCAAVQLQR